jgi:hypothetical protein
MKTKAKRASINGIPLEKIAANGTNGTNGHAKMHPLEEMMQDVPPEERVEQFMLLDKPLSGLSHEQRVEALGDMAKAVKDGKLTADLATCIVEEIRRRPTETQSPPQPTPEPSRQAPSEPVSDGAESGRDAKSGRFTTGNRFSRGNPFARRQAAMRSTLVEAVGEEKLRAIAGKLVSMAADGDVQAAALVLNYIVGRPTAAVDPDKVDVLEWKLLDAEPTIYEFFRALFDNIPAACACEYLKKRQVEKRQEAKLLEPLADAGAAEIMQARGQRSGRKRKPSAALPG